MRILFSSIHCYLDPSSGAALCTRELLELLAARGADCRVLTTGILDPERETTLDDVLAILELPCRRFRAEMATGSTAEVVDLTVNGVRVTVMPTGSSRAERSPDRQEADVFLQLAGQVFDRFRPDVLLTYGGHPASLDLMRRARQRGIAVVSHLLGSRAPHKWPHKGTLVISLVICTKWGPANVELCIGNLTMPHASRVAAGGICYHVLNRGNARAEVFHKDGDYDACLKIIAEASLRNPMRVLAYCLMPNHFHLALWPVKDGDLSRWMHWLLTTHVRRYQQHYHSSGHIWQGRFKAFPVQEDDHLRVVLRYIERNPLRAALVERAEDWRWSSLHGAVPGHAPLIHLDAGPAPRGDGWVEAVNSPMFETEVARVRESIRRDRPLGDEIWTLATAKNLGLEYSLHPRGRPPKSNPDQHGPLRNESS